MESQSIRYPGSNLTKRMVFMKRKTLWKILALPVALSLVLLHPRVTAALDQTYEQIKLLVDVLEHIEQEYVDEVDPKTLVYGAAEGMVQKLDPFSQFLEPDERKEMQTETEGLFGGIGIRITVQDGWLTVITPLPDTPAYKAGVLPGDRIVKIDGALTQEITLSDAVKKLRGAPKSKVTISIAREGDKDLREFTLVRENIPILTVRSRMLEDNIGYLRLSEFIETSDADIQKALAQLKQQGMTSLILDLRNNPGGLLNSAVDVSREFLDAKKLVVYTEGRASPRQDFIAETKGTYADLPLTVLVNHGSASGSEIVAGAMQDHKRAVIIGSESFGKGSVQSVLSLSDGSGLRLTTAKYYTPSGRSIHRNPKTGKGGITPDIVIDVPRETEVKLQAQSEEIYAKNKKPVSTVKKEDTVKDEVLDRAVEILKAREIILQGLKGSS
jgi:carboxyl-terminal processing protease